MATLSSTILFDSGSRLQMASNQAGQAIVPNAPDLPRMMPGFEKQMAQFTFGAQAPCDLVVVDVIEKYSTGVGRDTIKFNPLRTVIYQSQVDGHYGVFHIESYQNQLERVHETFGYKYNITRLGQRLHQGVFIEKGTPLSLSPNVDENGLYRTGISANVAYMSTHATIEDGFEVSESFLKRATPTATFSCVAEFGKWYYPINIYADPNQPDRYKPFPGIGEQIREDGVIFALRKYDPVMGGLEMTRQALQRIDYKHDKLIYGKPGARVFDITVNTTTNEGRRSTNTPFGMDAEAKKYADHTSAYYERILANYRKIRRDTNNKFILSGQFQTLIERALGDKPNVNSRVINESKSRKNSIQPTWRADPLDEWRVEVLCEYQFPMSDGAKTSDRHGG